MKNILLTERTKLFFALFILIVAIFLPACAGTKEREVERLILLQSRYSGSIIRIGAITKENRGSIATAFYTGPERGFVTARHVLMRENEDGTEYAAEKIFLHIPSCKTDYIANMGGFVENKKNYAMLYENDWASFAPTEDTLSRKPLRYDPNIDISNIRRVYIAGYPQLEREIDGTVPVEWLSTINLFTYTTKRRFVHLANRKDIKYNAAYIPYLGNMERFQGMSGGPALIWDEDTEDFIAVGILIFGIALTHTDKPLVLFIRPQIPPITPDPETN